MQETINSAYGYISNPGNANDQNQAFNFEYVIDDGKWYFPCTQFIGMKIRRVVRETTRKHCYQYGHLEGRTK